MIFRQFLEIPTSKNYLLDRIGSVGLKYPLNSNIFKY